MKVSQRTGSQQEKGRSREAQTVWRTLVQWCWTFNHRGHHLSDDCEAIISNALNRSLHREIKQAIRSSGHHIHKKYWSTWRLSALRWQCNPVPALHVYHLCPKRLAVHPQNTNKRRQRDPWKVAEVQEPATSMSRSLEQQPHLLHVVIWQQVCSSKLRAARIF